MKSVHKVTFYLLSYDTVSYLASFFLISGLFCETSLHQSLDQGADPTNGIVTASVIIVIAIIIAIVIYSIWYTRKSRRLKGQYKPSQMEVNGIAPSIPLDKIIDPTNGERLI